MKYTPKSSLLFGLLLISGVTGFLSLPTPVSAQAGADSQKEMIIRELPDQTPPTHQENPLDEYRVLQGVWKGVVLSTSNAHPSVIPGSKKEIILQDVTVRLLNGDKQGKEVLVENDFRELKAGDKVLVNYFVNHTIELYSINERDRRGFLGVIFLLFLAVVVYFGRKKGIRSLLSLVGAITVLGAVLVPAMVYGFPPLLMSVISSIGILFCFTYVNSGFNTRSNSIFFATSLAVIISGILSWVMIHTSNITGLGSDEAQFLNFNAPVNIDFVGLVLGGIIIASLGAIYEIAKRQIDIVRELRDNKTLSPKQVFTSAIQKGGDSLGSLINLLIFAYLGSSLPLLLLFSGDTFMPSIVLNQEVFATEIIRMIVGGISLASVLPLVTVIEIFISKEKRMDDKVSKN